MTMDINVAEYGKVAVLMGGNSAERKVSLNSGSAVLAALKNAGLDAHGVDAAEDVVVEIINGKFDRVFIVLHGRGGEDGTIQGALESLGVPYTGSKVLGCALAMDKVRTKQIWNGLGIPTPLFRIVGSEKELRVAANDLDFPMILKPSLEGSSIGISKISSAEDIKAAWDNASQSGCDVIAEAWVEGKEYIASILGDEVLPLIRLETPHELYDYDAKYIVDSTGYFCPCGLVENVEQELQQLSMKAFKSVDAAYWGRVDFMCDSNGKPWLIEVNTVPGMTDHSLVPMAAKAVGIDFQELVLRILSYTLTEK